VAARSAPPVAARSAPPVAARSAPPVAARSDRRRGLAVRADAPEGDLSLVDEESARFGRHQAGRRAHHVIDVDGRAAQPADFESFDRHETMMRGFLATAGGRQLPAHMRRKRPERYQRRTRCRTGGVDPERARSTKAIMERLQAITAKHSIEMLR
jgi:hypothetical protein